MQVNPRDDLVAVHHEIRFGVDVRQIRSNRGDSTIRLSDTHAHRARRRAAPADLAALRDRVKPSGDADLHDAVDQDGRLAGIIATHSTPARGAGLVAFLLALGVARRRLDAPADQSGGRALHRLALHADEPRELRRFAVINGVVMLLLVWGALNRPT